MPTDSGARRRQASLTTLCCVTALALGAAADASSQSGVSSSPPASADTRRQVPPYSHIFIIIAENKSYDLILGPGSQAPNLNALARHYGLASQFFAEMHPSEPNYLAMLGGDTFGIRDDDAFYCKPGQHDKWCPKAASAGYVDHTVSARSLMDQLQSRGLTWKAYMESLPEPGALVARWPDAEHTAPGLPEQLYAAKHNGFVSFLAVQRDPQRRAHVVDFRQLDDDLRGGQLPNFAHIVPNQCNDMHGRDAAPNVPSDCQKSNPQALIARGDRVIGELVKRIMASTLWSAAANSAIVVTFDENDKDERGGGDQGCCGTDARGGGGRIPTIVITNHGPRSVEDATPYNHYSLLRTTEEAFGITEYLGHAADRANGVVSMAPLFKVTR